MVSVLDADGQYRSRVYAGPGKKMRHITHVNTNHCYPCVSMEKQAYFFQTTSEMTPNNLSFPWRDLRPNC